MPNRFVTKTNYRAHKIVENKYSILTQLTTENKTKLNRKKCNPTLNKKRVKVVKLENSRNNDTT